MKRRNSTFSLKSPVGATQWLGFDLDMTMIRYKIKPLVHHIYKQAMRFLVEELSYPKWIQDTPYSMESLLRGVLLDKELGNFISIDTERRVLRAFHGNRMLSEEEITKAYPDPVDFFGMHTFRYWSCSSQFEIPYLYIIQQLVEHVDSGRLKYPIKPQASTEGQDPNSNLRSSSHASEGSQASSKQPKSSNESHTSAPSSAPTLESVFGEAAVSALTSVALSPYFQLAEDLMTTINFNFGNYEASSYFEPFRNGETEKFVFERSDLIPYLQSLRQHNVKVFLMTNSNHQYTHQLMNFAFGTSWRDLFDLIVYRAKKPQFFLFDAPFLRIVDASLPGESEGLRAMSNDEPLELGHEYYGGNLKKLKKDLLHDAPVIYVGDEPFGDVVAPSCYADWKTIAIVEELQEAESSSGWKSPSEIAPKLEDTAANLDLDRWGNYFKGHNGKLTFYGALIHHFADIAIPCVSRLAHFAPDQAFLPHHPTSQENATRSPEQKQRATVHVTEEADPELPNSFTIPTLDSMALIGELSKRLKEVRHTVATQNPN